MNYSEKAFPSAGEQTHIIEPVSTQQRANMGQNIVGQHQYPNTSNTESTRLFDNQMYDSRIGIETQQPGFFDDEKTMDQTMATTPTLFTDIVGALVDHGEDDDTTTIQSHDSITGAGLLDTTDDGDDTHEPYTSNINHPTIPALNSNVVIDPTSSACSVSTAPSTDETASISQDMANYLNDSNVRSTHNQSNYQHHRRVPSWEVSPHSHQQIQSGGRVSPAPFHLPPAFSPTTGWSNVSNQHHTSNLQVENRHPAYTYAQRMNSAANQWNHHQNGVPTRHGNVNSEPSSPRGIYYRQSVATNNYPYPTQQVRKLNHQPPLPPTAANTPPRMGSSTNERIASRSIGHNASHTNAPNRSMMSQHGNDIVSSGSGNSRSSSEVLKTLLRKKACLYEPDTSRAVALVTWLVGRELAFEFGYFSRQQLQAGVHACVANKIDSGVITRTKVNRCMQIILNSCFHYIIPRSDGSEESGESIRKIFSEVMKNDTHLLAALPHPWNGIEIDKQVILAACEEEMELQKHPKKFETPQSSPRMGSIQTMGSPGGGDSVDGDHDAKRAVLLCFNENVRSAEEVFRCHNEFIRDTAHACHLQLSSNEWQNFFGKDASNGHHLWGNVGIPVPYLESQGHQIIDALGMFTSEEAGVFRNTWCSKRYDHDHELCGFGHVEVNGGWLRRNPFVQKYSDELCQFISCVPISSNSSNLMMVVVNECPHGAQCAKAHSQEEIKYHPKRYKNRTCSAVGRISGCFLGEVCPCFHPIETYRFPKKSDSRAARYSRQSHQHASHTTDKASNSVSSSNAHHLLEGSPIIYSSPAPISSYENQLLLPGLKSLFRRQSAIIRAILPQQQRINNVTGDNSPTTPFEYNCFEDDLGITVNKLLPKQQTTRSAVTYSDMVKPPALP